MIGHNVVTGRWKRTQPGSCKKSGPKRDLQFCCKLLVSTGLLRRNFTPKPFKVQTLNQRVPGSSPSETCVLTAPSGKAAFSANSCDFLQLPFGLCRQDVVSRRFRPASLCRQKSRSWRLSLRVARRSHQGASATEVASSGRVSANIHSCVHLVRASGRAGG